MQCHPSSGFTQVPPIAVVSPVAQSNHIVVTAMLQPAMHPDVVDGPAAGSNLTYSRYAHARAALSA